MSIHPWLLEHLVCPACREDVRLLDDESGLRCQGCSRIYPIRDGLPVMLVDEARLPDDSTP